MSAVDWVSECACLRDGERERDEGGDREGGGREREKLAHTDKETESR